MPSGRALVALGASLGMWLGARIVGSPALHVAAVGLALLPLAAWIAEGRSARGLVARRRVSETRVQPGQRVRVDLEVENPSGTSTSVLLIEDRLPSALGRPPRLALTGIPPRRSQVVSYVIVPTARGRFPIGPVVVQPADPFVLVRRRIAFDEIDHLVVTPEIEDLSQDAGPRRGVAAGTSRAHRLLRTGEEFFTMREYQTGDDLRRLHWPSVARTGRLMIRQDESTRRARAVLFLDTRDAMLGQARAPGFERAVSAAASIGVLLARSGFGMRLATPEWPAVSVSEEDLLDRLAAVTHATSRLLSPALSRLRSEASAETSLVLVTAPLGPGDLGPLTRACAGFGPKLALLVYPTDPAALPPDRQAAVEGRAGVARLSLGRAGWDVVILSPSMRLGDVWHSNTQPRFATLA